MPLGVQHRGKWSSLLNGREARNRSNLLACCCLSSHPVPSQSEAPGAPSPAVLQDARRPFEKGVRGPVKNVECRGFTIQVRARGLGRFCVWTHKTLRRRRSLRTNGFGTCSHRGPPGTSRRPDQTTPLDKFASYLLESDFAVSPQGIGRACHREWEARTSAGAPLWTGTSPAMAERIPDYPSSASIGEVGPAFLKGRSRPALGAGRSAKYARAAASALLGGAVHGPRRSFLLLCVNKGELGMARDGT